MELRGYNPAPGPGTSCDSRLVTGPVVAFRSINNGAQVIYQASPMMFGQYRLAPAKSLGKKLENLRNDPNLIDVGPAARTRKLQQDESLTPFMLQSEWDGIAGVAHANKTTIEAIRPPTKEEKGTRRLPQILIKVKWKNGPSTWETYSGIASIRGSNARQEIYDAAKYWWCEFEKWTKANRQGPTEWQQQIRASGYQRSVTPSAPPPQNCAHPSALGGDTDPCAPVADAPAEQRAFHEH